MANNQTFVNGIKIPVVVTAPASPVSGQAVRFGNMTGVALADKRASDNLTPVDFGMSAWNLPVKGVNDGGNNAVAAGDKLYFVDADAFLSKKVTGAYFFGYALDPVTSGSTTTIRVLNSVPAGVVTP